MCVKHTRPGHLEFTLGKILRVKRLDEERVTSKKGEAFDVTSLAKCGICMYLYCGTTEWWGQWSRILTGVLVFFSALNVSIRFNQNQLANVDDFQTFSTQKFVQVKALATVKLTLRCHDAARVLDMQKQSSLLMCCMFHKAHSTDFLNAFKGIGFWRFIMILNHRRSQTITAHHRA